MPLVPDGGAPGSVPAPRVRPSPQRRGRVAAERDPVAFLLDTLQNPGERRREGVEELMERAVLAWMAATACFIASGCDTGCTEEGCVDGVEVWFASPLDASSELSVSVQLDAEQIQCDYAKAKALDSCAQKGVWLQTSGWRRNHRHCHLSRWVIMSYCSVAFWG